MGNEYFSHDVNAIGDIKVVKMMRDYDFAGFGYYWAIVAEIYRNQGRYEFEDLEILASATGIKLEKLTVFIDRCINKYTHKGKGLFESDKDGFWSNSLLKRIELREKRRAARAGATEDVEKDRKHIDGLIDKVVITEEQYNKLVQKDGVELTHQKIKVLEEWFSTGVPSTVKKYIGRNNYGHLSRSDNWVGQKAKKELGINSKVNWSI